MFTSHLSLAHLHRADGLQPRLRTLLLVAASGLASGLCSAAMGQDVLFEFQGESEFDFFGWSVNAAGDVNADGHDDLVVGGLGYVRGPRAVVYSGVDGSKLHEFSVLKFASAAGAGDVDGDGFDDIIVGDIGDNTNGSASGAALVFSGLSGAVLHVFNGAAQNDYFGISVDGAGDVNGDGLADLVIGAYQPDTFNPGTGYAQVYSGLDGSLLHHFQGEGAGDSFGVVVGAAGDVNADGFADVIIGAPRDSDNGQASGGVRVFSGKTGALLFDLDGPAAGDQFGRAVSGVGDVNGDGRDDFLIGAPFDSSINPFGGSAMVFSGLDGTPLQSFFGEASQMLGAYVSGTGDVDGDDIPDMIVGAPLPAPNLANVYSGADGKLVLSIETESLASVSGAGDMNADGRCEVVIGDPGFEDVPGVSGHEIGRAVVYSIDDGIEIIGDNYCGPANLNSTGQSAVISAFGSTKVSKNTVELTASLLPLNVFGYFLNSDVRDFKPFAGGSQGNLCLGGGIGRHAKQVANTGAAGELILDLDITALPRPGGTHSVVAGETWNFQCWFRDNQGGPTSNFTDGIEIVFQ